MKNQKSGAPKAKITKLEIVFRIINIILAAFFAVNTAICAVIALRSSSAEYFFAAIECLVALLGVLFMIKLRRIGYILFAVATLADTITQNSLALLDIGVFLVVLLPPFLDALMLESVKKKKQTIAEGRISPLP